MKRVICFDIETTGFEYTRGDRVIEIGAVEIIDGKITENSFHSYINPDGKVIPPDSYKVHKLSNAFLEDKPLFKDVAKQFLDFIGDSEVVAHNGNDFDFPFINYELNVLNLPQIPRSQQQDSLTIARNRIHGPKSYTLDNLAKFFNISLATRADAHGALIDSKLLAQVYLELMEQTPAKPIEEIIAEFKQMLDNHPKIGADFPMRKFPANDTELNIHNEFVSKIVND